MNSYNLTKVSHWASGSQLYEKRTEGQIRAEMDRHRGDLTEQQNRVLREADLKDENFEHLHFYPMTGGHETYK